MNTKKDRLEQVYEYVRMKFNIHTKTDFAGTDLVNKKGRSILPFYSLR